MFAKVSSLGLFGLNAFHVDVEIDISRGNPQFDIVGLPDTVVRESRERIRSALRSCDIGFPVATVMINLAPADTKKSGSVHDMAIFMAVLKGMRMISADLDGCSFIGELSLNGDIRRINGVLPMVMLARELGIKSVFVPSANSSEASVIDGIDIYGVDNAEQLIKHFRNEELLKPCTHFAPPETAYNEILDFSDIHHLVGKVGLLAPLVNIGHIKFHCNILCQRFLHRAFRNVTRHSNLVINLVTIEIPIQRNDQIVIRNHDCRRFGIYTRNTSIHLFRQLNFRIIIIEMRINVFHGFLNIIQIWESGLHLFVKNVHVFVRGKILQVLYRIRVSQITSKEREIIVLNTHQFSLKISRIQMEQHIFITAKCQVGNWCGLYIQFFLVIGFVVFTTDGANHYANRYQ